MSKYDSGINRVIITPNVEKNLRADAPKDYVVSVYTYAGVEKFIVTEKDLHNFIKKGEKNNGSVAL